MLRGLEDTGCPRHVVVVGKAQKVLALVKGPLLRAELPLQGVDDLKQIHRVEGGVEALIALIVGTGVEQPLTRPLVIVSVEGLPHQEKLRLQTVAEGTQPVKEILVQAVGHVQAQPVDIKLLHPEFDAVQQIVHYGGISEVELHQLVVPLPALIPKAVAVIGIPVKIDMEPVLIG